MKNTRWGLFRVSFGINLTQWFSSFLQLHYTHVSSILYLTPLFGGGQPAPLSWLCSLELIHPLSALKEAAAGCLNRAGHTSFHHLCTGCLLGGTYRGEAWPTCMTPMIMPLSQAASGLGMRHTAVVVSRSNRLTVKTCRKKQRHCDRNPVANRRESE